MGGWERAMDDLAITLGQMLCEWTTASSARCYDATSLRGIGYGLLAALLIGLIGSRFLSRAS